MNFKLWSVQTKRRIEVCYVVIQAKVLQQVCNSLNIVFCFINLLQEYE